MMGSVGAVVACVCLFAWSSANSDCTAQNPTFPLPIDVSPLAANPFDLTTAQLILNASETWGFFQVVNHSVDPDLILRLKKQMLWFFLQPLETKLKVKRTLSNSRGFAHDELTKQLLDYKEIFDYGFGSGDVDGVNQFPQINNGGNDDDSSSVFHDTLEEYFEACTALSFTILRSIAVGLKMDPELLAQEFHNHSSFARLNFYPANAESQRGISRHTDAGALTVLWQDSPGLQVYSGTKEDNQDGMWIDVPLIPNTLTINVGDMMHVWTGGRLAAAEHRVILHKYGTAPRLSAPFFFNPSYATLMRDFPEAGGKQKYRPFTWEQFRRARFLGDYANVGKESQIEDWEIHQQHQ